MFLIFFFLLLQPRNFKSKKIQKNRKIKYFKNKLNFNYGSWGLCLTQPIFLNSKKIFKIKLILKRLIKKSDKTRRKFWFFAFPHLPMSKKFLGSRMGKGKGKLNLWFTPVSAGIFLIELKNIRLGRSLFFLKKLINFFNNRGVIYKKPFLI